MNPFLEALDKILQDHCTFADVRRIEAGGSSNILWQTVEQSGFLDLLLPEEQGGAALPLVDLFPILERLGRAAVPQPVAQSIVARALLAGCAGVPAGRLTLAMHIQRDPGGASVSHCVPYGAVADHVLCCDGDDLALMSRTRRSASSATACSAPPSGEQSSMTTAVQSASPWPTRLASASRR